MSFYSAFAQILILTACLGAVLFFLGSQNLLGSHEEFAWWSLLFFVVVTPIIVGLASFANKVRSFKNFSTVVFGSMGLKFIFSLLIIVAYFMLRKPEDPFFIIPFFAFYALYSVLETRLLLKMTRFNGAKTPSSIVADEPETNGISAVESEEEK